ncbi:uncharacterized protein LOC110224279 isoform X2 [Arabidopsis lyrata subsp. lyrata]|uniref:uncharacterized protein LOC110224279 isoform X2 n=1 Tax=Arabidopsis lyrata subsp. lyrata TaxID=81972 RepID=UPI000A29DB4B|nr:uncharacterized protein LOC110224279 isoform X2 [Arabidopsis lyrata subsp. lyrata]|eukprot:XP_020865929.1 uncharacterized protein LOC110224279 isoform X2 [Arabidopsis lyrata subsp. lyrata]
MWRETYRDGIRPVQGMPLWPRTNRLPVLPPPWRRGNRGRPNNHARRKGRNETASSSNKNKMSRAKRIMTCSNCLQEGHNRQGCKNATVLNPLPRPRGRPRKRPAPEVLATFSSQAHPGSQEQVQGSQGSQPHLGSQGQGQGSQAHLGSQQGSQAHQTHGADSQIQPEAQPEGQGLGRFASWFQCST